MKLGTIGKTLSGIIKGKFLDNEELLGHLPFILFITFLILLYIANNHYTEKMIREKETLGSELKELQSEYITTKSELMYHSKQSAIAKPAAALGLKEATDPPQIIVADKGWFD